MTPLTDNIFGLQIRRLKDLIANQAREAFWRTGIELDARLSSIVIALFERRGQTSSELAAVTGLSRQLVEARLKSLEKDGYVTSIICANDARKRTFSLSRRRRNDVARTVEIMTDFEGVYKELWCELDIDLSEAVLKLERALHAKPLLARLCNEYPEYEDLLCVRRNMSG